MHRKVGRCEDRSVRELQVAWCGWDKGEGSEMRRGGRIMKELHANLRHSPLATQFSPQWNDCDESLVKRKCTNVLL